MELDRFAQNFPSEQSIVKDIRKKLFSLDPDFAGTTNQNIPRKPIGFGTPNSTPTANRDDDFFETPKKTAPSRKVVTQKGTQSKQTKKDDFFDSTSPNMGDDNISKYTNNDFNF